MLNKVILQGRLTRDPELKYTTSNVPVLRFSLAVQRSYAPKGAERKADFFDLVAWRSTAEFISNNFKKGQEIAIVGALRQEDWTDRNGNKRTSINVVVEDVNFCGPKYGGQRSSQPETQFDYAGEYSEIEDDGNVPF